MAQEQHNTSRGGLQPQTLAELAMPASDRFRGGAAVATAEALRPQTHSKLVLKGTKKDSAENAFLRGIHYMGVITTALHSETYGSDVTPQEVTEKNIERTLALVKPSVEVLLDLQEGIGILNTLIKHNTGTQELHSVQEAKALFGQQSTFDPREAEAAFDIVYTAESSFGQFVAGYNFGEAGVRAEEVIAAFLDKSFGRVKNSLSYEEPPVQEVVLDFIGTGSLIKTVAKSESEVDEANAESAADPLGLDENNKRQRVNRAFSLVAHEWRTPLTALSSNMQLAERALHPAGEGRMPDSQKAVTVMNRAIVQVGRLETMRQHIYDALQKGFVPAEIPLSRLAEDTQSQLRSWLGDRVLLSIPEFPADATVSISPSVWNGIVNNAWQNAVRARQALLLTENEGLAPEEAAERARNEVQMLCSVVVNEREDTVRILMTDDGRGITKGRRTFRFPPGDHGYDVDGVETHGIAMNQYAEALRRNEGADAYLLQTAPGVGATLIVKLRLNKGDTESAG